MSFFKKIGRKIRGALKNVGREASKVGRGATKAVKNVGREGSKLATGAFKSASSPKKLLMQGLGGGMSQTADFAGKQVKIMSRAKRGLGGGKDKVVRLGLSGISPARLSEMKMAAGPLAVGKKKEDEEEKTPSLAKPFKKGGAVAKKPMAKKTSSKGRGMGAATRGGGACAPRKMMGGGYAKKMNKGGMC